MAGQYQQYQRVYNGADQMQGSRQTINTGYTVSPKSPKPHNTASRYCKIS